MSYFASSASYFFYPCEKHGTILSLGEARQGDIDVVYLEVITPLIIINFSSPTVRSLTCELPTRLRPIKKFRFSKFNFPDVPSDIMDISMF